MTDLTEVMCEVCQSRRQVRYCRECTRRSCVADTPTIDIPVFYCKSCKQDISTEICGYCGTNAIISAYVPKEACSFCGSTNIGDPELLLKNLPSDFYSVIAKVEDIAPDMTELFRSFEFMVALVQYCRLAGFLGFPQMEQQLEQCSGALGKINQRVLRELSQIRQEALYDLRRLDYLQNVDLMHFRNAETVMQSTSEKIDKLAEHIQYWIAEVKSRIEELKPLAFFLRKHHELLVEINRYLPEGIHDVAAIIPPISMHIKLKRKQEKGECYIIFTEEYCVFLPKSSYSRN